MKKTTQAVKIERLPIELYKFLKLSNIVQSGGEAKMLIYQRSVTVNGQIETQNGKKLRANDTVEIKGNAVKFVIE